MLYGQHGTQLVARRGNRAASAWDSDGHGEHSVEAQVHKLQHYVDNDGVALGALAVVDAAYADGERAQGHMIATRVQRHPSGPLGRALTEMAALFIQPSDS